MGLRLIKHIKLSKHIRLNISKSGIGISGGVKGARISYNPKTGVRRSVGIPGSGIYYSDQHKLKNDKEVILSSNKNIKDQNYKKLSAASKKLNKISFRVFIGFFIVDLVFFKSTLLLYVIAVIEAVILIGTYIDIYKRYRICNKENKML